MNLPGKITGVVLCAFVLAKAGFGAPVLEVNGRLTNGWFSMGIRMEEGAVYWIERSRDLAEWETISVLIRSSYFHDPVLPFTDTSTGGMEGAYYRVRSGGWDMATNDWKNVVFHPRDSFQYGEGAWSRPELDWVKFAIVKDEPDRVYYQNSSKYNFHYDFAAAWLPQFAGMTRGEFDLVSLYTNNQQVVLGTLLYPPWPREHEVGVQFAGEEPYATGQVLEWLEKVRASIAAMDTIKLVYVPTHQQRAAVEGEREIFAAHGIEVGRIEQWTGGDNCYSGGWAMGRLKFVRGAEIELAYARGELGPEDILLTDAVPADIPYVSGVLTLEPATPNSHVAILALQYGIPFGWLESGESASRAMAAIGKDVIVFPDYLWDNCTFRAVDISGMEDELRNEIAGLKSGPTIQITPKEKHGSYTASTDHLTPEDIKYFGGKAANFGFLRRTIPTNSPRAIAISFDLWDEFMEQKLPTGKSLREEIDGRLSAYGYPVSVADLKTDLAQIRAMITDWTQFTAEQQEAIAAALLGNFDPHRNIRFRSSTNVEDSENFTGAGLYDSFSGCLADDLDGDASGPSICDGTEKNERGVFRAMRKVYASFYNDNAVLERMRNGVNESEVGMAILVHHSTPDEIEMANGVATVEGWSGFSTFVSQPGAISVTNPENGVLPEIYERGARQWSSLLPVGRYVFDWPEEYSALSKLLGVVAREFREYHNRTNYILDFEYKKVAPGELLVKQVREIPLRQEEGANRRYLLNEPQAWCVYQGDQGTVFANHRLKRRFWISTRSVELMESNLTSGVLSEITFEYVKDGTIHRSGGRVARFTNAEHKVEFPSFGEAKVTESWVPEDHPAERWVMEFSLPLRTAEGRSPFVTLPMTDTIRLSATYDTPQIGQKHPREMGMITNEWVQLWPCAKVTEKSVLVEREVERGGVRVQTQYYWPESLPPDVIPYKTMHLVGWKETVITGLTAEPIVLRGYFSQTNRPAHHNFGEEFIFEPRLEEGMAQEILTELEAKNIRAIYMLMHDKNEIFLLGPDGSVRRVEEGWQ